jgi:hypothetical protein
MKTQWLALSLATLLVPSAHAAQQAFNFSYGSLGGAVISGQLLGTLQSDQNAILVASVVGVPTFNGAPAVALPFVDAIVNVAAHVTYRQPIVSLNGSQMDFAACTSSSCDDGFGFESSGLLGYPVFAGLTSFGNLPYEGYVPSAWHISAVPESATALLMAMGLGGIGLSLRLRARP